MAKAWVLGLAALAALSVTAGPGWAGDYELIIKTGRIESNKADGSPWDALGNAPDPYVTASIRVGKNELRNRTSTKSEKDTYRPDWNEKVLTVDVGDDVVIWVTDKDLASDDFIGEYKFTVTKKLIEDGEARVSFDQVKELHFVLKKAK
jgi:hypothetical protein